MCAIVGYHSPKCLDRYLLMNVIKQSKIRGLHSFGISYYDGCGLETRKSHEQHQIMNHLLSLKKVSTLIYHNRYSTSGDWKDHKNNQPLHMDDLAFAFNGTIDMRTKSEMEKDYGKMVSDNDGEIFMKHILSGAAADDFSQLYKCTFAGVWLRDGVLNFMRNFHRPMWAYQTDDTTMVASTRDIFERAGADMECVSEVEPYTHYRC